MCFTNVLSIMYIIWSFTALCSEDRQTYNHAWFQASATV